MWCDESWTLIQSTGEAVPYTIEDAASIVAVLWFVSVGDN